MPKGDKTGPAGRGPMTGRAAGYCAGYAMPGYANPAPNRNFRAGFGGGGGRGARGRGFGGGGHGWRNMLYATGQPGWMRFVSYAVPYGRRASYMDVGPEDEKRALQSEAEALQVELDRIKKRLSEIESAAQ